MSGASRSRRGAQRDPGLRDHARRRRLLWLSLIVLIPLAALFLKTTELSLDQFVAHHHQPRACCTRCSSRSGSRSRRRRSTSCSASLVVWALVRYELSRPAPARRHRRHSVRAADRGRRHRADQSLCRERLDRQPAGAARHQGRVHAARHLRRAGLHRTAVRRAHRAAGARRPRSGARGGRGLARRQPLDHHPPRHPAEPSSRRC